MSQDLTHETGSKVKSEAALMSSTKSQHLRTAGMNRQASANSSRF
jgi:hypothetical protein